MPGSIHVSIIQLPVTSPLFLQVAVGKREYNGSIGEGDFSFPVMSLRENMVMMLYNADRALISQTEVKTKAVVETGTWDVSFTLEGGGNVLLRLQFVLSDEERKRIREMRNSALKRKQQERLRDGHEIPFPDRPPSKQHTETVSNNRSKGNQPALRKSLSLDDLQERDIFCGRSADPHMDHSEDMVSQSGGRNSSKLEDLIDIHKGMSKPESRSISSVKKMISAFESSLSQSPTPLTRIKSESSLRGMPFMSVSSEKLSDTGLQANLELSEALSLTKQEEPYLDRTTWRDSSGKSNLFVNPKSSQNAKNNQKSVKPRFVNVTDRGSSTSDSQYTAEPRNITGSTTMSALLETRKDISTNSSYETRSSAASNAVGRSLISAAVGTSGEVTLPSGDRGFTSRSEKSIHTELNASEKKDPISSVAGMDCSSSGGGGDGATKHNVRENARKSRDLNVQMVSRGKKQSFQAEIHLSGEVLGRSTFISDLHSLEQIRAIDPAIFRFSRNYYEHPMNHILGTFNIWMQPRLCITTGSRQLRDLLEHPSTFTYMQQLDESMSITEANEKKNAGDDEVNRSEISCNRTDGVSMLNGWLVNQGVRVVIVIIACGAIFLNNR